jgi:hypothetical protein
MGKLILGRPLSKSNPNFIAIVKRSRRDAGKIRLLQEADMTRGSHDLHTIVPSKGMPQTIRHGSLVNHPRLRTTTVSVQHILTKSKICVRRHWGNFYSRTKRSRGLISDDGMGGGESKMYGILILPVHPHAECLKVSSPPPKLRSRNFYFWC